MQQIPFNKPLIEQDEIDAVTGVLRGGRLEGNAPVSKRVEKTLEKIVGAKFVLLMTSCTHALETAVRVLDLEPGDEVILPSFSFPSAANAVLLAGMKPVFAEVQPDTLNLDPEDMEKRITGRTRAVIPVHYAGVACDMGRIMEISRRSGLKVIEDAAQCMGAYCGQDALGTIGEIGAISFHATKNVVAGEGGAFITNNEELFHKADIFREKGTNRSRFLAGEIDKYSWVSPGSSYVLSDILAALLEVQLGKLDRLTSQRGRVDRIYRQGLLDLESEGLLQIGAVPQYCRPNYHIFFIQVDPARRDSVLRSLKEAGIQATTHFYPLHLSEMGRRMGWREGDFPVTETAFRSLIRLPIYPGLPDTEAMRIVETLQRILH